MGWAHQLIGDTGMKTTIIAALGALSLALPGAPGAQAAQAGRHVASHRAHAASHAGIPQSSNIERLNDISLQRARSGQSTTQPLAPPLNQ